MKFKRLSRALMSGLLAVSMTVSMTACGGNTKNDADAKTEDPAKTETSDSGNTEEPTEEMAKEINWYSSMFDEEGSQELAKMFEEKTGIKVNVYWYDGADFVQAFMVAVNGGSSVDVMTLNGQDVRYFMKNGLIQELTGKKICENVNQAAIDQYTYNGKLWAVGASGGNSSGIYANMDVIDQYGGKVPQTLDEMIELNNKLKADGKSLFSFGGGSIYMWPMWYFSTFAQTSGGKPIERTEEVLTGKAKFTDADSIEAFEVIKKFAEEEMWQPGFNGTDSDGGKAPFVNGDAALFYGGTWETTGFRDAGLDHMELFPFPIVKEGAKSLQTGNASDGAWAIYSKIDPAKQSAAEALIDFATCEESVKSYANAESTGLRNSARIPVTKGLDLPEDADPLTITQKDMLETMTFTHLDWIYPPEITKQLQNTLQSLTGLQITPEEAGEEMQTVMDQLLADGYDYNAAE